MSGGVGGSRRAITVSRPDLVSEASRLTKKSVPLLPRWYLAERPNQDLMGDPARSSQCFGKNYLQGRLFPAFPEHFFKKFVDNPLKGPEVRPACALAETPRDRCRRLLGASSRASIRG